jgi:hypothetical protein
MSRPMHRAVTALLAGAAGLLAQGQAPPYTVTPASLNFGNVQTGRTAVGVLAFHVSDTADSPVTFDLEVRGDGFSVENSEFTIPRNQSRNIRVFFTPARLGTFTGRIVIEAETRGRDFPDGTVLLSGTGVGASPAPAVLTADPVTLDFGEVAVGETASRPLTIRNTGQAPAQISSVWTHGYFRATPASFNLNSGAAQLVTVTFSPTAAGTVQAQIDFMAPGATAARVAVTGRSVVSTLGFTVVAGPGNTSLPPGGSITMPGAAVGSRSTVDLQIRNPGTSPLTLNRILATGSAFRLANTPFLPFALAPGRTLTLSLSFEPAEPGIARGALSVNDQSFALTGVGLVRGVAFTGPSGAVEPLSQPAIGVRLSDRFATALSGQLTLEFVSNAGGAADPAIQFATGGRVVAFTIPANADTAVFPGGGSQVAFQTGSVSGTIHLRVSLQAGGVDVSPAPAPVRAVVVARSAPRVSSASIANRTATGFQVVVAGFATGREVNNATFRFNAAESGNLQTGSLTVDVNAAFSEWYRSPDSGLFGSQFSLIVPFEVQGDVSAMRSVSVTLRNADGASQAVEARF